MKCNFKKIASVLASAVMLTSTLGVAVAANYPSPFVENGQADGAIIVGSSAPENLDGVVDIDVAGDLQSDLNDLTDSSSAAAVGEESALVSGTGDDLTLGESLNAVKDNLDEGELPTLLAEGTLEDDSVDYDEEEEVDYDQKLQFSGSVQYASLGSEDSYSVDTDASEDELPVLNIDQSSGQAYNLTIDFSSDINATSYDDSEAFTVGGKELTFDPDMAVGDTELVLFEASETVTIGAGESVTVGSDTVKVIGANTDSNTATLEINGNLYQVEEGDTEEGYYVNNIFMQTVPTETASVELFAGSKEWKIDDLTGSMTDLEVDGNTMDGVQASVDATSNDLQTISSLTFSYTPSDEDADEKDYLEVGEQLEDPLFDLKMVFDSAEPALMADSKDIVEVDAGDTVDISFTSRNGNEYSISPFKIDDSDSLVVAEDDWYVNAEYTDLQKDSIFIASEGTSSSEETLIYQVNKIDDGDSDDGDEKVEFTELSSGSIKKVSEGEELEDTGLYLPSNLTSFDSFALQTSGGANATVNNELVTDAGMGITLTKGAHVDASGASNLSTVTVNGVQYQLNSSHAVLGNQFNATDGHQLDDHLSNAGFTVEGTGNGPLNITGFQVYGLDSSGITANNFTEIVFSEDRDTDVDADTEVGLGSISANVSVDPDSDDDVLDVTPSFNGGVWNTSSISGDTDKDFALSELGTYAEADNDERTSLDIWTTDEQTVYNVYFSSTAGGNQSGANEVTIATDDDMTDVADKNLIVVGGSCVNDLAAEILGVDPATCGSDFTDATGVGEGEHLIKAVQSPENSEKVAVLVAGYEAGDTEDAANRLMDGHSTDVGTEEIYPQSE